MKDPNKKYKPVNPDLRTRLEAYREDGRSNSILAREIGCSDTAVSLYLSDKFVGDIEKFEERAENILRTAPIRELVGLEIFQTGVTQTIAGAIQTILKTNDFAVIHGPAGIGKTCAAAHYVANHPTSIFTTLYQDCCNAHYIQKQIFETVKSRAFRKSGLNRTEWIFQRLKGSNRLLVIDNGHRATAAARKWLFDFHDCTGCPVILLGNPEIIETIKTNDQQFSRIGLCPEITLDPEEIPDLARLVLQRTCPEHAAALEAYAITVATHQGHLRNLSKQLRLTLEFIDRGERDPRAAFRAAHTQLPRHYSLS